MARINRIKRGSVNHKALPQTDTSSPEHPGNLVNPASERLANNRKANDRKANNRKPDKVEN